MNNKTSVANLGVLIFLLIAPLLIEASEDKSCTNPLSNKVIKHQPVDYKLVDSLIDIATEYRHRGEPGAAIESLKQASILTEKSSDKVRLSTIYGGLSDAYLLSRQLDNALHAAEKSLACAGQSTNSYAQQTALNNYANTLVALQRYKEALSAYQQAIILAKQHADKIMLVKLQINLIHLHLAEHSQEKANQILKQSSQALKTIPNSQEKAYLLIAMGNLAQRLSKDKIKQSEMLSIAHTSFTHALNIASNLKDIRAQSYALGHLGELYTINQGYAEAEQLFQQATFLANQIDAPELITRWWWQRGRLYKAQKKTLKAEDAYRKSLEQLATIQPALVYGLRGNTQSFRKTVGIIYLELVDILLKKASKTSNQKDERKILKQVRAFMEQFKTVELNNYFQDDCIAELQAKNTHKNSDELLSPGTAILYPIIFAERITLLLSLADGSLKQYSVPIRAEELTNKVATFRYQLQRSGNITRIRSNGLALYNWLIKPLETELTNQQIKTLIVVPDGILGTIPFAAFFDGEGFLVNRYAFVTSPGLSLTLSSQPIWVEKNQLALLNGLSINQQNYNQLPNVEKEIEKVAKQFNKSTQLLNEEFTKQSVENQLQQKSYTSLLFASHAELKANPKQSFILTYDDKILLNDLSRILRIGRYRDNPVDLLVLSACDTARGDERAAFGLAGVAVKAGVSSVLASLWSVSDESTADLIPQFFKNLKQSRLSKAQALQKAQIQLLNNTEYKHPFHWASFVLFGHWL